MNGQQIQPGGGNPFANVIGDIGTWWQKRQSQYHEQKRQKALAILDTMRKFYPNRYQAYKKSMQPDEVGYMDLPFEEGTNTWAEVVVDKYGDVLSPQEELQAKQAKMMSQAIQKVMGRGGAPGPLPQVPKTQLPEPTLGPQPQVRPQPVQRPMPQPQQGISREMAETILGFSKPGNALKQLEVQLKAMGLLDQQTKTQIAALRARIDEQAETRAGKEFGITSKEVKRHHEELERGAEDRLTESQKQRKQTAINQVYGDVSQTMKNLSGIRPRLMPEQRLKREQQAKIEGLRRLLAIDPGEARSYGKTVTEGILSASRAIVTNLEIQPSAETAGILDGFKMNLTTISQIAGMEPIKKALKARFGYLAKRKDTLNEREKSLLSLWHRWLSEMGVDLEPLEWKDTGWWDKVKSFF